jgi:hypothetical protein
MNPIFRNHFTLFLLASIYFLPHAEAQTDFSERTKIALKAGDSQKLSRNCAEKVELGREGDAEVLNPQKAGDLLAQFFQANPPSDAVVHFQGKGKDGKKYLICKYKSKNGSAFRFSFYWKERLPELFESIDISKD